MLRSVSDVTRILDRVLKGDANSAEELLPLVYDELRRLAAHKMANEVPGQTLQPTALVHEAWLRISSEAKQNWREPAHFFAVAAEAMRRILIDQARRKQAARRGGDQQRVQLEGVEIAAPDTDEKLLAVHEALDRFARHDSVKAELVKLHYFAGLSLSEAAEALGVSLATAKRYWSYARAWLYREIKIN